MTSYRWPQLLATAGVALMLPACLSFPVTPVAVAPPEKQKQPDANVAKQARDQPHRDRFAELPSRPGEVVVLREPETGTQHAGGMTTSQRPENTGNTGEPTAPPKPDEGVKHEGDPHEPGRLPGLRPEPLLMEIVRAHLEHRPERALELLKELQPANQEFVLAVLPALARGATADLASDPTATALLADELRTAISWLAPRSALMVENATLCWKVYGFGRYEPWPQGRTYRPNDRAQLYLEVRNLVSQPATGPQGETHLTYVRGAVEIRDAHNMIVDQPDPNEWRRRVKAVRFEEKRYSRGPVEDFHILHPFTVPSTPGVYTVTVELRDPAGRRSVKTPPIRFDVAGP